ncbi:hypothetical protein JCM3775_000550 [Rhodotorula graminis]|uniref:Uncharacterized protein n=1 Tax=Rhodotorula graminis (strain WP1) TaxID=578459 RepID=A0A0P9EJM7_RHOGW|nr:uncharacterized protein RHOBADRAFT_54407 [Rhodotorula graminis WP1]KPV73811.1 hypothetical protein RHOBADRAFT_54407 [Rhodotorula graminis WP1]
MRLALVPAASFLSQPAPSASDPPLVFIDREPFLVELQGSLEGPTGEPSAGIEASKAPHLIDGARVGKVDLSDPKKPVLRIAHHRLEGKLETLLTPYALLRTSRAPPPSSDDTAEPASKRPRLSPSPGPPTTTPTPTTTTTTTRIELVALIRRKLVFSKRPEPLVDVSSEADPLFADKKRRALAEGAGGGAAKRARDDRERDRGGAAAGAGAGAGVGAGAGGGAGATTKAPAKGGFFAPRKAPTATASAAGGPTGGATGGSAEGAPRAPGGGAA